MTNHDTHCSITLTQNGNAETGSKDGFAEFSSPASNFKHLFESISAIEFLAERYCRSRAFFGMELINEPSQKAIPFSTLEWVSKDVKLLKKFWKGCSVFPCAFYVFVFVILAS